MFDTLISQCIQEDAVEIECDVYLYIHICMPYSTYILHICMRILLLCFFCTHSWALFCPDFFGSRIFAAELRICSKLSLNKAQKTQRGKKHELARIFPCIYFGSMMILNKALLLEVFFASKSQFAQDLQSVCLSELYMSPYYPVDFVVKNYLSFSQGLG